MERRDSIFERGDLLVNRLGKIVVGGSGVPSNSPSTPASSNLEMTPNATNSSSATLTPGTAQHGGHQLLTHVNVNAIALTSAALLGSNSKNAKTKVTPSASVSSKAHARETADI